MADKRVHVRLVLLHCFKEGRPAAQAEEEVNEIYGARAPGIRQIYRWYAKFRAENVTLEDRPRAGTPRKLEDADIRHLLEQDRNLTTEELAESLDVDPTTVFRHLKTMGYRLKLDTWVPHTLTHLNKLDRFVNAKNLLVRFERGGDAFVRRIVTADEKWVVHNKTLLRAKKKRSLSGPPSHTRSAVNEGSIQHELSSNAIRECFRR